MIGKVQIKSTDQPRMRFWFVKLGTITRITTEKAGSARDACINCYGMVNYRMLAKPISTRRRDVQSDTFRNIVLGTEGGWHRPELISKLEKIGAPPDYKSGCLT